MLWQAKLKNIRTGRIVDETFRAGEKIEVVRIEARDYSYLYSENDILGLNRKCDNILEKINEIKQHDKLY